jgi:hypothetical protein
MSNQPEDFNKNETVDIPEQAENVSFNVDKIFEKRNMEQFDNKPEKLTREDIDKYNELNKTFFELNKNQPGHLTIYNPENNKTSYLYPFKDGDRTKFPTIPVLIVRDREGNVEKYELTPVQYEKVLKRAEELLNKEPDGEKIPDPTPRYVRSR